jgi:hypothetical protein
LDNVTKRTDRHGSIGFSSSTHDLSRLGAFEDNGYIRASSVSDVRADDVEKVYIAKVK